MERKICKKCGKELPLNNQYFSYKKGNKDGFNKTCKQCCSNIERERKAKNNIQYIVKDGMKKCKKCKRILSIKYFTRNATNTDGYNSSCINCQNEKLWNQEDIDIMIEHYSNLTSKEIQSLLSIKRSEKAIRNMAVKLNLRKQHGLIENYNQKQYKIISSVKHKLCKTCGRYLPLSLKYFPKDKSCKDGYRNVCKECKGENFNITNIKKWSANEINLLCDMYNNFTNIEISNNIIKNRNQKQINNKAYSLRLKKSESIKRKALKDSFTPKRKNKISERKKGDWTGVKNPQFNSNRYKELNPNWKGGVTKFKSAFINTNAYKQWRNDVFNRDNYTCQCCGKMTHDIEAHHLNCFSDFPEQRLLIENGITLCKQCHNPNQKGSFHNIYGTFHNTKQQFNEYLIKKGVVTDGNSKERM